MKLNRKTINRYYKLFREKIACFSEQENGFEGEIELDESYFGGKHHKGKRGRGSENKIPVFGILKRNGKVYTQIIPNSKGETLLEKGFKIVQQYSDNETAKKEGRTNFNKMLNYFKENPDVRILLVEKTDRLYRNFKDYIILEDYDLEVHLAKEGSIISKNARSHDKFIHGIKVLMAKTISTTFLKKLPKVLRKQ
jgi:transposase-like protein